MQVALIIAIGALKPLISNLVCMTLSLDPDDMANNHDNLVKTLFSLSLVHLA